MSREATKGADEKIYISAQTLNFAQGSYLERTSRPIYAIVFLLPFIIFYELGTIFINTDLLNQSQVRVVAFVWLQNFLEYIGISGKLAWAAPALAVILILLALQIASKKRWHFNLPDFFPMAIECTLLAVPLIVLSLFLNSSTCRQMPPENRAVYSTYSDSNLTLCAAEGLQDQSEIQAAEKQPSKARSLLANIVTGIGAGIYEELIFRLILICLLMLLFHDCLRFGHKTSILLAILISAALFSAHHHIVFLNGRFGQTMPLNYLEFGFRTAAGVYFAALFAMRGFAITAGTHAFYDRIATLINAAFFSQ